MSEECFCDFDGEPYTLYEKTTSKARVPHKCYECGTGIRPGEQYERIRTLFEGLFETIKTCARCIDAREYITAHAPCFCWQHGSMLDDAKATVEQYGHESAGFYIGAMKRVLRAQRGSNAHRSPA